MMTPGICTLFEGHYHFGVAAFANSLHIQGFNGPVFVGYRGTLPSWCNTAQNNDALLWQGAKTIYMPNGLQLHFLPLETDSHFTNYKPDFMLRLIDGPAKNVSSLFYFDPDIVVVAPWHSFEVWVKCGVALCEDVNSPLAENHPRRVAWRRYYNQKNIQLVFKEGIYANGGFVGVSRESFAFIETWKNLQNMMAPEIGGLSRSSLNGPTLPPEASGPFAPFGKTDQDALNAAVEAWTGDVSFVGKEAMGFASGLVLLPHALGHPKPWKWKPISQAILGQPPRVVDREYWKAANKILCAHSVSMVTFRQLCINFAAFIGRFYRRGGNGGAY